MFVKQHMSVPPITIRSDADYQSALAMMQEHAVHHVPVLDREGRLAGIVAERDLLLAASRYLQSHVEVAEVMHRGAVTVTPDTPLAQAATLLARHKIGGLPVVAGAGQVVGVITETDMLLALVDALASAGRRAPAEKRRRVPAAKAAKGKRAKSAARSVKKVTAKGAQPRKAAATAPPAKRRRSA